MKIYIICFLLVLFNFVNNELAYCSAFDMELKNGDSFYVTYFESAIIPSESETFTIGFRVCKLPESEQISWELRNYQYDLILENKTDKLLQNLHFITHFKDSMQIILASSYWYNEPMDLSARNNDDLSFIGLYSWSPLVSLRDLGILGHININDFYEFIIEIIWDGGSEIIKFSYEDVYIPARDHAAILPYAPLDQDEIDTMIDIGIKIRIELYGE